MRTREVRKYYNIVNKRRASLMVKRLFDIVVASIMLAVLALPMLIIAILIKCIGSVMMIIVLKLHSQRIRM